MTSFQRHLHRLSAAGLLKVLGGGIALTLLVGCGGGGQVLSAGEVTVLVSKDLDAGMSAELTGRLEVVGGCLGANQSTVIWPHGTEVVNEDPLRIEIPTVGTFGLGDELRIGGGYVLEHTSTHVEPGPFEEGGVTVPADCAAHDIFLAHADG